MNPVELFQCGMHILRSSYTLNIEYILNKFCVFGALQVEILYASAEVIASQKVIFRTKIQQEAPKVARNNQIKIPKEGLSHLRSQSRT